MGDQCSFPHFNGIQTFLHVLKNRIYTISAQGKRKKIIFDLPAESIVFNNLNLGGGRKRMKIEMERKPHRWTEATL